MSIWDLCNALDLPRSFGELLHAKADREGWQHVLLLVSIEDVGAVRDAICADAGGANRFTLVAWRPFKAGQMAMVGDPEPMT